MLSLPITNQAKQEEWNTIYTIAKNNVFPLKIIYNTLKTCTKTQRVDNATANTATKTWVTFTYHSPPIYKVTNPFKHTNRNTAFRTNNTIYNQLQNKTENNLSMTVEYINYSAKHEINHT
jgi:hypothetical protein